MRPTLQVQDGAWRPQSRSTTGWLSSTQDLYRYVWRTSARSQVLLAALAVGVFLLELAPLELQRRIVNNAVESATYHVIALLCGLYLVVVLTQGGLKLVSQCLSRLGDRNRLQEPSA